jgi:hypothetical protein
VPDNPSYQELQEQIDAAVASLDALAEAGDERPLETASGASEVVRALRTTLIAVGSSLGECREAVPYQPMHPVRKANGTLIWCCTHDPAAPARMRLSPRSHAWTRS